MTGWLLTRRSATESLKDFGSLLGAVAATTGIGTGLALIKAVRAFPSTLPGAEGKPEKPDAPPPAVRAGPAWQYAAAVTILAGTTFGLGTGDWVALALVAAPTFGVLYVVMRAAIRSADRMFPRDP